MLFPEIVQLFNFSKSEYKSSFTTLSYYPPCTYKHTLSHTHSACISYTFTNTLALFHTLEATLHFSQPHPCPPLCSPDFQNCPLCSQIYLALSVNLTTELPSEELVFGLTSHTFLYYSIIPTMPGHIRDGP